MSIHHDDDPFTSHIFISTWMNAIMRDMRCPCKCWLSPFTEKHPHLDIQPLFEPIFCDALRRMWCKQSGAIKRKENHWKIHFVLLLDIRASSFMQRQLVLLFIDFLSCEVVEDKLFNSPLFVVFDSASATSARSFLSGGWVLDNEWKSSSGHKLASVRRSCLISTLSRCLLSRSFSLLSRDSVTLSGRWSLSGERRRRRRAKLDITNTSRGFGKACGACTNLQIVFLVYSWSHLRADDSTDSLTEASARAKGSIYAKSARILTVYVN